MANRLAAFFLTLILCVNVSVVMAAKQSSTSGGTSKRFVETRLMAVSGNGYNQAEQTISMGDSHAAAVKENGDLYCWGSNTYGQVGDGTHDTVKKPKKVLKNVASVTLYGHRSAAITKDGDLYCWGEGFAGNGTTGDQRIPVKVLSNVTSIEMSVCDTAAVTKDGDLYYWGPNSYGQAGHGTRESQLTPVKVLSNVVSVALGDGHIAAVTKDGDLYCWGNNYYGQVGNGNRSGSYRLSPVLVLNNVESIALCDWGSAALTYNGDLYCWGENGHGEVGNGTTNTQWAPMKILEDVVSFELNENTKAAVTKTGELYCWGENRHGTVGNGTKEDQLIPEQILDGVESVYMKNEVCAAITMGGDLHCWGVNNDGQLGNGTREDQLSPNRILKDIVAFDKVSNTSAALTRNGDLYCWGYNYGGLTGNGKASVGCQLIPEKILGNVFSVNLKSTEFSSVRGAAVTKKGDLYCWGYNHSGQVGNGTIKNQASPVKVLSSVQVGNSSSTDQEDSLEENDDKDNETDSNIDLNIYKANRYLKKGTPSNHTVQSIKDLKYPSQILVDALNKDHGSFEKKVTAWKAVHYAQSPADILNGKLDEKGYYEAIILSIFVSQSDSDGFIGDIIKKANSEASSVLKNVSAWAEKSDSIEASKISKNQILSTISPEDQAAIREHCAGLFTKNHPLLDNASFITGTLETLFAATDTIGEAIDRMSAYAQLSELSLQQKVVLKKMYGLCPSSNVALKGALAEVAASMDSFDSGLLSAYANAALGQGTNVVGVMVNDAWKAVITANPYAAAFQAGASVGTFIGDKVCSTLFSTDKTVEQYQKMQCLGEFSKLLQQTVEDLKSSYQKEKTKQNARNYLESVETVFAVAYLSCEFAKNYGDIIFQDALVGQLVHTAEDIDAYILTIERTNQNYHEMHAVLETDYLTGLEIDYPQIYGEITGKTVKEDMRESSENLLKKIGVSVDQSSFNIATQKPRIKISFPNGKKPDEYEKSTLKSSNPKVAAVDKGGRITGKKKGKSMITVKVFLKSGSYKQVKFQVTVHGKKATVKKVLTTVVK